MLHHGGWRYVSIYFMFVNQCLHGWFLVLVYVLGSFIVIYENLSRLSCWRNIWRLSWNLKMQNQLLQIINIISSWQATDFGLELNIWLDWFCWNFSFYEKNSNVELNLCECCSFINRKNLEKEHWYNTIILCL